MSNGVYFDANGKRITEMVNDDVFIIGQEVDGVQRQKTIAKIDILPQDLKADDTVSFAGLNITGIATINLLQLGNGNTVSNGTITATKRMIINIDGVNYYIALQPV